MSFLDYEKNQRYQPNPITTKNTPATWVEIDATAFAHNIALYKSTVGSALFAPVIKSNAYGHDIEQIALLCDKNIHVDYLCVVALSEAIFLRTRGIRKPLLVLSILDSDFEHLAELDIATVVYDLATAQKINTIGARYSKKISIHVKVDTGLSRLGFLYSDAVKNIIFLHELPFITLQGIFTHFASSESSDTTFTTLQLDRFQNILMQLNLAGIDIPLRHTSCSAAITAHPKSHYNFVRAGVGIYGLWPSPENKYRTQNSYPEFSLQSVLSWKTRIIQIKEIPLGSSVGYDQTHHVSRATRIAILPVGYWDGFDRRFSNNGIVIIHGQAAPILGRIAMNLCMVDITMLHAEVGDVVELLGNAADITADALAQRCDTINYEVVTRINPLLPRIVK